MFEWAASKGDCTWGLVPWHSSDPLSHQLGLQRVSLFGGMERWNGMVEWNSGMEWWNSGMTTPIDRVLRRPIPSIFQSSRVKASQLYRKCLKKLGSI